ncbi:unnamed protein product [Colias eurytheme]|nr:unnamed protein product [Colias eurytheme]
MFCLIFILIAQSIQCEAGRRIFQGRDVVLGEFPYVANWGTLIKDAKKTKFDPYCTCSIISPTWAISAAHCMEKPPLLTGNYINYASHVPSDLGKFAEVLQAIAHPNYDFDNEYAFLKNDICLIRTKRIQIATYAVLSAVDYLSLIGQEVFVAGYGATNDSSEVDLTFFVNKPLQVFKGMVIKCLERKADATFSSVCFSSPCGSLAMICGGDSGGPVIHTSGIVAVNSWSGNDCEFLINLKMIHKHSLARAASGVGSPVSAVLDWISHTIANTV